VTSGAFLLSTLSELDAMGLAVITSDGRYVYATFDAGASGTGGVAVVDVRRRKVVDFALQSI